LHERTTVEGHRRATILIVEDDPDLRHGLRALLEGAGYDVITARDGREALTHIGGRALRLSLILLDWLLPVMPGQAFLTELSLDPVHRGTPVVVLSGHDRIDSKNLGVTAVLTKPVRSRTLVDVVGRLLDMPARAPAPARDTSSPHSTRHLAPTIALRRTSG
jgi:DNA-binding response OmpR family regulator